MSNKLWFKFSNVCLKSLFASWPTENSNLIMSIKRRFNKSNCHKSYFLLLTSPKFNFGEVEKSIFQVVTSHRELIFFLLTIPKCNLGEVEKAMLRARMSLWTHFRPLDNPKIRLGWVRETNVSRTRIAPATIFGLLTSLNATWLNSIKRLF